MSDYQRKYVKLPNFGVVAVVQVGVFVKSQRDVGASPTRHHTILVPVVQVGVFVKSQKDVGASPTGPTFIDL